MSWHAGPRSHEEGAGRRREAAHLVIGHHEADDDAHEGVQKAAHQQAAHDADWQVYRWVLHLQLYGAGT